MVQPSVAAISLALASSRKDPTGFVGFWNAGSSRLTTEWVTTATTGRGQPAPGELVAQRLDEHVPDRALGVGDGVVHRDRIHLVLGELGAAQDEAHLRPVAMGDNEFPALLDHVDQRRHRAADGLVLLRDRVVLGVGDQCVAAEGHDRGAHSPAPGGRPRPAPRSPR